MLLLAPSVCGLFKWRQFEPEVILLAVGWYLRFSLSYRDVEELLAERGLLVDHVTVWRWVQRYAPEIQRRLRPRLQPTNDSWRMNETYIRSKVSGCIYIELLTPAVRQSTSFCQLNATQQRLSAFSRKPWAERTIPRRG
jgi:transposase-like protein